MIIRRGSLVYRQLPGRASADPLEMQPQRFSVRVVRLKAGERRTPHRHPFSAEVIYVVRGKGSLWEGGSLERFGEGDCALIEAGVGHATLPDPDNDMELVCFFPHADLAANTEELHDIVIVDGREQ